MFNNVLLKAARVTLMVGVAAGSPLLQASPGTDTATLMEYWYRLTARDCGSGRLASDCSGLILRGTDSKKVFRPWNAGPNSHNAEAGGNGVVSNGGVSASYLRKDAEYDGLGLLKYNGFALIPNDFINENDQFKVTVLCAFPIVRPRIQILSRLIDFNVGSIRPQIILERSIRRMLLMPLLKGGN